MEIHLLRFSNTIPRTGLHRPIRSPPRQSKTISSSASAGGGGTSSFDAVAYEAERLRLDTAARDSMAMVADRDIVGGGGEGEVDGDGKAWKWRIRKRIWDLMEAEGIARNPRPVHHRIPNFDGAGSAAVALGGKKLLTPQPRLRTGFFSVLESRLLAPSSIMEACTSVGVAKFGRPIGLDEKIKVDLIVIGSVVVDPRTGARLGKGEGFAELEYGMLRYMGAIDDSTLVVTSAHDRQLVDDIPTANLLIHDVPVDIICTPTQVIYTNTSIPKPQGIYWDKLSPEKLGQIRVLRDLKRRIERETGQVLPSGPSEKLPPTALRK